MPMTPLQADCLAYIQFLLAGELKALSTLYKPSAVMAHIQIESNWEPEVGDHVDSFGSAGLMQVLPSTATQMGVTGSMLEPANSILAGMRYLENCHVILAHYRQKAGGALTIQDVVAAYNEGPGNVMNGRADPRYVIFWERARIEWTYVDALPMDPKAVAALENWGKPAPVEPTPEPTAPEPEAAPGPEVTALAFTNDQTPPAEPPQSAPTSDVGKSTEEVVAPVAPPPVEEPPASPPPPPAENADDSQAEADKLNAEELQTLQASGVQTQPVDQATQDDADAAQDQSPDPGDEQEQSDSADGAGADTAEDLNAQELASLPKTPA